MPIVEIRMKRHYGLGAGRVTKEWYYLDLWFVSIDVVFPHGR